MSRGVNCRERGTWSTAFGAWVHDRRIGRGWSQEELAEEAGLSRVTVLRIEKGARVADLSQFVRLADALTADPVVVMAEVAERAGAAHPG